MLRGPLIRSTDRGSPATSRTAAEALSAGLGGAFSSMVLYPIEICKNRLQASQVSGAWVAWVPLHKARCWMEERRYGPVTHGNRGAASNLPSCLRGGSILQHALRMMESGSIHKPCCASLDQCRCRSRSKARKAQQKERRRERRGAEHAHCSPARCDAHHVLTLLHHTTLGCNSSVSVPWSLHFPLPPARTISCMYICIYTYHACAEANDSTCAAWCLSLGSCTPRRAFTASTGASSILQCSLPRYQQYRSLAHGIGPAHAPYTRGASSLSRGLRRAGEGAVLLRLYVDRGWMEGCVRWDEYHQQRLPRIPGRVVPPASVASNRCCHREDPDGEGGGEPSIHSSVSSARPLVLPSLSLPALFMSACLSRKDEHAVG